MEDINEHELKPCEAGWGFSRTSYRLLFWNFLWCKNSAGKLEVKDHPLRDYHPRRLLGNLWWVPNLKTAWAEHSRKYAGTLTRLNLLPHESHNRRNF